MARGYASQPKQLAKLIAEGMRHKGFAFIHVLSPCVTFNKAAGYDFFKDRVVEMPAEHKSDDLIDAMRLAMEPDRFYTGLFFRAERPEFTSSLKRTCLLYTSDAADERSSVDLGGRRIIKKQKRELEF